MKIKTQLIAKYAIFTALVTLATVIIQIPIPSTQDYLNLGDSIIFFAAIFINPIAGLICGGIGSMLADLFSPYAFWAPYTLVVKGLEGLFCGMIFRTLFKLVKNKKFHFKLLAAVTSMVLSGLFMVFGYFISASIIGGSFAAGVSGVPFNLIQSSVCVILSSLLFTIFARKEVPFLKLGE